MYHNIQLPPMWKQYKKKSPFDHPKCGKSDKMAIICSPYISSFHWLTITFRTMIITFRKQKTLDVYSDVAANPMSLADTDLSLPTVDFWKNENENTINSVFHQKMPKQTETHKNQKEQRAVLNLNIHNSYFHTLWIIRTNTSHFGMCEIYVRPILRF